jgi:hypothetical protein
MAELDMHGVLLEWVFERTSRLAIEMAVVVTAALRIRALADR